MWRDKQQDLPFETEASPLSKGDLLGSIPEETRKERVQPKKDASVAEDIHERLPCPLRRWERVGVVGSRLENDVRR